MIGRKGARMPTARRSFAAADPPAITVPAGRPPSGGDRFLRWPDVHARTGLSRTTVWRLVRHGTFPAPRRLSANAVAWLSSEVDAWIASRTPTRASAGGPAC